MCPSALDCLVAPQAPLVPHLADPHLGLRLSYRYPWKLSDPWWQRQFTRLLLLAGLSSAKMRIFRRGKSYNLTW